MESARLEWYFLISVAPELPMPLRAIAFGPLSS